MTIERGTYQLGLITIYSMTSENSGVSRSGSTAPITERVENVTSPKSTTFAEKSHPQAGNGNGKSAEVSDEVWDEFNALLDDDDDRVVEITCFACGEIDWDEFQRVINGDGPCNRDRIEHHKKAHAEGAWVRDALRAYESKKRQRLAA